VSNGMETAMTGAGCRLGFCVAPMLAVVLGLGLAGTQQAAAATTDVGAASPSLAFRTILLRPPRSSAPALGSGRAARLSASSDGVVTSASGMGHLTIVPNFDDTSWDSAAGCEPVSSSPDAASLEAAFDYAAGQIEAEYSDPITVDLGVCVDPGDGVPGESEQFLSYGSSGDGWTYAQVRAALLANETTSDQVSAGASLPVSDPTPADGAADFAMSYPEADALGLDAGPVPYGLDAPAAVVFDPSGDYFTYDYSTAGPVPAGQIYFVGVAEHEITETMGRVYGLEAPDPPYPGQYVPNDLFRYTAPAVRSLVAYSPGAYLSIDGGVTNLVDLNSPNGCAGRPAGECGDPQDYAGNSPDAFNAYVTFGVLEPLTEAGLTNFDVLGFDRAAASVSVSPATATVTAGDAQFYTAEGVDALDNQFGVVPTLTIAPDGSGSATGASCTVDYCSATAAGTYTVTETYGSATATATLTVTSGLVASLSLSPVAQRAVPGDGVSYTAEGFDGYGNDIGDLAGSATFSIAPDGSGSATGASCSYNSCQATIAGTYTVTATDGPATGSTTMIVVAGLATSLTLSPAEATVGAGDSQAYQVEGFDSYGNDAGDVTAATTFTIAPDGSGSATGAACAGDSCSATAAGTYTVTGTDGSATGTATLTVTPGAVDAAESTVSASPGSVPADGSTAATVTVTAVDADGNQETSGGATVTIASSVGTVSGVIDNDDGTYTATVTSLTAGTADVKAKIDGAAISPDATVVFGPDAATSTIAASSYALPADGSSTATITVTAVDGAGNELTTGGAVVTISSTAGSVSGVTDNGNGTYTATLTSPATAGTADVSATIGGQTVTSGDPIVSFGAAVGTRLIGGGLSGPTDAAADASGDVFIADPGNSRVVEDAPNGSGGYIQTTIGSGLNRPHGVAVDASGDVFIADTYNNRVVEETPDGDGGFTQTTVDSSLSYPFAVAVDDATGAVYVADTGNRRVVEDAPNGGGGYTQSFVDGRDGFGVGVDMSGDVYIADTVDDQVIKETPVTGGGYTGTYVDHNLRGPYGVAVDGSGDAYVANTGSDDVVKDTPDGGGYTQTVVDDSGPERARRGWRWTRPETFTSPTRNNGRVLELLAPVNTAAPAITGTAQDGLVLTRSSRGTWSDGGALSYADQWERCSSTGSAAPRSRGRRGRCTGRPAPMSGMSSPWR
jgi:hypothetical protein